MTLFPVLSAHIFISVSHAQLHSSKVPLVYPRISLFTLSLSTRYVQDTTPEGALSSCGCSLALTPTTSIDILHGAGATKS